MSQMLAQPNNDLLDLPGGSTGQSQQPETLDLFGTGSVPN